MEGNKDVYYGENIQFFFSRVYKPKIHVNTIFVFRKNIIQLMKILKHEQLISLLLC